MADAANGVNAVEAGHLEVHQSDIWTQLMEARDGFLSVGGFADQLHVFLEVQGKRDAIADEGVVVNAENADVAWVRHDLSRGEGRNCVVRSEGSYHATPAGASGTPPKRGYRVTHARVAAL